MNVDDLLSNIDHQDKGSVFEYLSDNATAQHKHCKIQQDIYLASCQFQPSG